MWKYKEHDHESLEIKAHAPAHHRLVNPRNILSYIVGNMVLGFRLMRDNSESYVAAHLYHFALKEILMEKE